MHVQFATLWRGEGVRDVKKERRGNTEGASFRRCTYRLVSQ